jgi:hypothetical protein
MKSDQVPQPGFRYDKETSAVRFVNENEIVNRMEFEMQNGWKWKRRSDQ